MDLYPQGSYFYFSGRPILGDHSQNNRTRMI